MDAPGGGEGVGGAGGGVLLGLTGVEAEVGGYADVLPPLYHVLLPLY